ncbi:HAD family phosphatase [Marinomonas sp. 5E14-1]|uniref:HAD family hydrolase n=1 Tax=Marinomonas sp. 5E14-1 TaxID=3153922 RepID=UPI0032678A82
MALAFFDLDNTLVKGDTAQAFSEYLAASALPTADDFLAVNEKYMEEYDDGTLNLEAYMHYTLAPLFTLDRVKVGALIRDFIDTVVSTMIPDSTHTLLAKHKDAGDDIVIISATGIHLVEPITKYLGVEYALGVNIEIIDDYITGKLIGIPTFREGKVIHAEQWAKDHGYKLEEAYFYSDSHNDLPLLEKVGYPVAVGPDPVLKKVAEEKNWPIVKIG